jgi:hypothetical protein
MVDDSSKLSSQNPGGDAFKSHDQKKMPKYGKMNSDNKPESRSPQTNEVLSKINKSGKYTYDEKPNILGPILFFFFSLLCFGAGILMHDLLFKDEITEWTVSDGLSGIVKNPNAEEGLTRCGVYKNKRCVVYIQNTFNMAVRARDFYSYAKAFGDYSQDKELTLTIIETNNKFKEDYGEKWIEPGEFAEIIIPGSNPQR